MIDYCESHAGYWFDEPWNGTAQGPRTWLHNNFRNFLLSESVIVAGAVPYTGRELHGQGVYFLIHHGAIVYVGQSGCVGARIQDHAFDKDFEAIFLIPEIPKTWLETIERFYIFKFRPIQNRWHPSSAPRALKNILDLSA
jgi:hypothetical protein